MRSSNWLSGVTDIGIIVGDTGEQVRAAVGDGSQFGAQVTFIQQTLRAASRTQSLREGLPW
jgi:dTDP-glucose pyrophosphorylase